MRGPSSAALAQFLGAIDMQLRNQRASRSHTKRLAARQDTSKPPSKTRRCNTRRGISNAHWPVH